MGAPRIERGTFRTHFSLLLSQLSYAPNICLVDRYNDQYSSSKKVMLSNSLRVFSAKSSPLGLSLLPCGPISSSSSEVVLFC